MKSCPTMVDVGRRKFLSGAGLAAAGAAAATVVPPRAEAGPQLARLSYPSNRLANVSDLKPNAPLQVAYPDADAPGVLLKLGAKVPGGVGPEGDIVGFTTICPHKGFPLNYNAFGQDAELPRPLFALRLRERRPGDLGSRDPKSSPISAAGRRQGRHLRRRRRRTHLRPPVERAGGLSHDIQAPHRSPSDHPGRRQGAQRRLPVLHRRLRLPRLHVAASTSRAARARRTTTSASTSRNSNCR